MAQAHYTKRVIEGHELFSSHLLEERTLKVYLPPEYREDVLYPVLYCHDGGEFFTHGRIATIANQLIMEGKLRPLVIVGIAVQKVTRTDDYAMSGRRHEAYLRFVADECVPFVEDHYSVHRDGAHRFMAGISLGAVASLSLYLHDPDMFPQLLLFSGAYFEDVRAALRERASYTDLRAWMLVGRQETEVDTSVLGKYDFYHANHAVRDLLTVRGADVEYHEDDGTHIWGFWQRHMPSALAWVQKRITQQDH
ncbi:MAG: esterase family protein [Thermoflavifilum sp.]|nr:esterase family protein [Thermoflavifilum sp.]MCL6514218.1 esterase family protein [Alicyclobacillus sp.]